MFSLPKLTRAPGGPSIGSAKKQDTGSSPGHPEMAANGLNPKARCVPGSSLTWDHAARWPFSWPPCPALLYQLQAHLFSFQPGCTQGWINHAVFNSDFADINRPWKHQTLGISISFSSAILSWDQRTHPQSSPGETPPPASIVPSLTLV